MALPDQASAPFQNRRHPGHSARESINQLPGGPKWVVGDRGYSSHGFREHISTTGARPAIRTKRKEEQLVCPDWAYNKRTIVERLWARLKEWRAVATRYEKTAVSFAIVLCLAATLDWIKSQQALALLWQVSIRVADREQRYNGGSAEVAAV